MMRFDTFTERAQDAAQRSAEIIQRYGHNQIDTEHLLLALLEQPEGVIPQILERLTVNADLLAQRLDGILSASHTARRTRGGQRVTDPQAESRYRTLEKYSRDLTQAAKEGKLDPVIGRDKEILRVLQILSRRTKNNPVLIGEAGVGTTGHGGGLAQKSGTTDGPE